MLFVAPPNSKKHPYIFMQIHSESSTIGILNQEQLDVLVVAQNIQTPQNKIKKFAAQICVYQYMPVP